MGVEVRCCTGRARWGRRYSVRRRWGWSKRHFSGLEKAPDSSEVAAGRNNLQGLQSLQLVDKSRVMTRFPATAWAAFSSWFSQARRRLAQDLGLPATAGRVCLR